MGTLITWFALLIGIAALAYTWKLHQELNTATRRLDRYNRALFEANDEIRQLREEATATAARLRVELKQRTGNLSFQPEMTVREVQMLHPQAPQVLADFHLGGCNHCAVEPEETLAQVCTTHGLDINVLLNHLNGLLNQANRAPSLGVPQMVKLPNVELSL